MKSSGLGKNRGAEGGACREAARAVLLRAAIFGALLGCSAGLAAGAFAQPEALEVRGDENWSYENQKLRVNVWHGREENDVYRRGDPITISFETNQDAYAVVYRIDAGGEVTILWPRSRYDDGFVFGRHAYTVPGAGAARLRAGPDEGVEYVEAIVSMYPFDLRDLEVDFIHEANEDPYRFVVAGDPFLAMNEVNFAVTRLENAEDYVITNYASYYVGRRVDHPRYMCAQCHTGSAVYDPYADTCVISIHYDYGWYNSWYVRFGWYPVYYYPAYYYVDPWSWSPWVNYWYTPWYSWPAASVYSWPYDYYVWRWSPYWEGDAWTRWKDGDRRYVPLDKQRFLVDAKARDARLESVTSSIKTTRPSRDVDRALTSRTKLARDVGTAAEGKGTRGRGGYANVERERRQPAEFRDAPTARESTAGVRIGDRTRTQSGRVLGGRQRETADALTPNRLGDGNARSARQSREGEERSDRSSSIRRSVRARSEGDNGTLRSDGREEVEKRGIRPVEPRKPGTRIWSGGRSGAVTESRLRTSPSRPASPADRPNAGQNERARDFRQRHEPARGETPSREQPQVRPEASGKGGERASSPARPSSPPASRSSGSDSRGKKSPAEGQSRDDRR